MDRLKERLEMAQRAFKTLEECLNKPAASDIERDGAIQRFEYTMEATWKAAQRFLQDVKGLSVGSPKDAVRRCRENGVLNEEDAMAALAMIDDRNLTVHTYIEELAVEIYSRLPNHRRTLGSWLENMEKQVP